MRQQADTEVDSHRKTEMKDPNSKEGDTEEYLMNLSGRAELKTCTGEP